jgi:hypothetical protein
MGSIKISPSRAVYLDSRSAPTCRYVIVIIVGLYTFCIALPPFAVLAAVAFDKAVIYPYF